MKSCLGSSSINLLKHVKAALTVRQHAEAKKLTNMVKRRKCDRHACWKNQNMLYQICPARQQSASTSIHALVKHLSFRMSLVYHNFHFSSAQSLVEFKSTSTPFHAQPCCQKVTLQSRTRKREALNWHLNECKSKGLLSWWFMII